MVKKTYLLIKLYPKFKGTKTRVPGYKYINKETFINRNEDIEKASPKK